MRSPVAVIWKPSTATFSSDSPAANPMVTRSAALPCWTESKSPRSQGRSAAVSSPPTHSRRACPWPISPARVGRYFRTQLPPLGNLPAVCGAAFAVAWPVRDGIGRNIGGRGGEVIDPDLSGPGMVPLTVCWRSVTVVEAHPAVMASAIRHARSLFGLRVDPITGSFRTGTSWSRPVSRSC